MADSLSVNVDSPPKLELSAEQAHRTIHEAEYPPPSNIQKAIAEFVGTYILIFAGCGAALVNERLPLTIVGIAIVSGLALTVAIYSVGHVSGGHFNPAVTIALAAVRKIQLRLVPTYVLCQLMGATLASLTLKLLYHDKVDFGVTVTQYLSSTSDLEAMMWESIITSILMLTICGVATDPRGSKELAGVAIGISVLINVIIAGPITGASMNPARSLGPAIVSGDYKNIWVYIIGPTLGAILASLLYRFLEVTKPAEPEDRTRTMSHEQS
ncbi:nodulin-26-like [Gastrolobium bilobum]|uniref:nodulin-26-like n=1 Tax=Gastrolobium bilobum TaxID=150636 RepID=UPI002AB030EE|nr:nodulin-26-like [Gastrolobium bilobum]